MGLSCIAFYNRSIIPRYLPVIRFEIVIIILVMMIIFFRKTIFGFVTKIGNLVIGVSSNFVYIETGYIQVVLNTSNFRHSLSFREYQNKISVNVQVNTSI